MQLWYCTGFIGFGSDWVSTHIVFCFRNSGKLRCFFLIFWFFESSPCIIGVNWFICFSTSILVLNFSHYSVDILKGLGSCSRVLLLYSIILSWPGLSVHFRTHPPLKLLDEICNYHWFRKSLLLGKFIHVDIKISVLQAEKASWNSIGIFKLSNVSGKRRELVPAKSAEDDSENDSDSSDSDDEVAEEGNGGSRAPVLQALLSFSKFFACIRILIT